MQEIPNPDNLLEWRALRWHHSRPALPSTQLQPAKCTHTLPSTQLQPAKCTHTLPSTQLQPA